MNSKSGRGWRTTLLWLLRVIAALLVLGSVLSTTDLNQWWIRIWDFPRLQILAAMILAAVALWKTGPCLAAVAPTGSRRFRGVAVLQSISLYAAGHDRSIARGCR